MGSSRGQDRSLGTGLSLPQWMKGRMDTRYDFDQNSFSPPSSDDSFFYIRYPKSSETIASSGSSNQEDAAGYRPISQVLSDKTISSSSGSAAATAAGDRVIGISESGRATKTTISTNSIKDVKNIDFSKHPLPCQPFVPSSAGKETSPTGSKNYSRTRSTKSQGTDDGFHGEPALCGKSIVDVANRIMSKNLMKIEIEGSESKGSKANTTDKQYRDDDFLLRKGSSKSLPVTPIASPISTPDTSPKSRRKMHTNRYFTGPFIPDREKYQAGWILSSILGQSRDAMGNSRIQEEEEESPAFDLIPSKYLNRKKSISSQNLSYLGEEETRNVLATASGKVDATLTGSQQKIQQQQQQQTAVYTNVFEAKPSELREMNFWSPTSM